VEAAALVEDMVGDQDVHLQEEKDNDQDEETEM
jgi:hypothetical protein